MTLLKLSLGAAVLCVLAVAGVAAPSRSGVKPRCSFGVEARLSTPKLAGDLEERSPDADDAVVVPNGAASIVVAALKEGGLAVYSLDGQLLQRIAATPRPGGDAGNHAGRFNNVAMVQTQQSGPVVVVSDRGLDQLRMYRVDGGGLVDITADDVPWVFSRSQDEVNKQETAYGLTAANYGGQMLGFVSRRRRAQVAKVVLKETPEGNLTYEVAEMLQLPVAFSLGGKQWSPCSEKDGREPQLEGLVVDTNDGTLMMTQEIVGLWKTSVERMTTDLTLLDGVSSFGVEFERFPDPDDPDEYICEATGRDLLQGRPPERHLEADAEGMSLYAPRYSRAGFYVVSSQGADRFEVFERAPPHAHLASFTVAFGRDTVQRTDGVEIYSEALPGYRNGLLVVQDEDDDEYTSFKFVSVDDVIAGLHTCLST